MLSVASLSPIIWIAALLIANLIAIAVCVAILWRKTKRQQGRIKALNNAIREYFRHGGVEVQVASTQLAENQTYIAFIESEPMKRFRLSHIIEIALREHVAKTCKLHLAKIFWRFPLKDVPSSGTTAEKQQASEGDSYINEGLVYYRDLPKGDVQEVSWEKFEESAAMHSLNDSDTTPPSRAS